jgi:hypothetical protein
MSEQRIRVLIAGVAYKPNQFTRAVERYGCEAVHISGDTDANFPRFCDAAICVSSYMSHQHYWQVKQSYKEAGKPVWLTGVGFSQIQEHFEKFLKDKRGYVMPPEKMVVGQLKVPAAWLPDKEKEIKTVEQVRDNNRGKLYDRETRLKIYSIIQKGATSGRTLREIANDLNNAGLRKVTGGEWLFQDVTNMKRTMLGKNKKGYDKENPAPPMGRPKAIAAAATVTPPEKPKIDGMSLIQQISICKTLEPAQKIELIQRVSLGEIDEPEYTEKEIIDGSLYIEQVSILRAKNENPHLHLTKEQAELILNNLAVINNFVQGSPL